MIEIENDIFFNIEILKIKGRSAITSASSSIYLTGYTQHVKYIFTADWISFCFEDRNRVPPMDET